jgi:hypothetical protein
LQRISKKEYQILIFLTTFVVSVWMCLANIQPFSQVVSDYGYDGIVDGKNLFSFLYVYMLGGYIGMYMEKREKSCIIYLIGALLCVWVNYFIWTKYGKILDYDSVAISYANPFVVLNAVFLLLFFKDLHFYNPVINRISSTTIGIYALHELEYMRNFIWKKFSFEKIDCSDLGKNLLRIFSIMLLIFFTGAVIELLRQELFKGIRKGKDYLVQKYHHS